MRKTTAAVLAAFSSYGWTQQLVAAAPPADGSGFVVVALVAVAGGLVFLKTKKPEVFDKLVAKLKRKPKPAAAPQTFTEPTLPQMAAQPTPPMYSWLVAENDQLRDTNSKLGDQLRAQAATIARLQAQINSYATAAPSVTVQPQIPTDFVGFLKA